MLKTKSRRQFFSGLITFLTLTTFYSSLTAAEPRDWSIDLNGLSYHSESRYFENGVSKAYHQTNLGLGLSVELNEWRQLVQRHESTRWIDDLGIDLDIKVGFFDNSYEKTSFYLGPFFHKDLAEGNFRFAPGLALLLTTGYDDTPEDAPRIAPLPVLALEVGHRAFKINLGYIPWGQVELVTLQLQIAPNHW